MQIIEQPFGSLQHEDGGSRGSLAAAASSLTLASNAESAGDASGVSDVRDSMYSVASGSAAEECNGDSMVSLYSPDPTAREDPRRRIQFCHNTNDMRHETQ